MRKPALVVVGLASLLTLAGFGGALHRAADTLALARPLFGLIALAGFVAASRTSWRIGFAAVGLAALASVGPQLLPQSAGGDLRVYSKNLWAGNRDPAALVADIEAAAVDAVFLQEVSDRNVLALDLLRASFPHQHLCRFQWATRIAVLSRLPFDGTPTCSKQFAMAAAPVRVEGDRVWLVSTHLPWPWPYDNAENETAAETLLESLDAPAVIAGDFNAFPWTWRVRRLATASNTRAAGPVRPTLFLRQVPLPIDLAFAPGGGSLERRPQLGSDHFGIVADLALNP
ncbi:MAG TPA: hypothetical protein DIU07_21790 [Rhodobacteraceae bacterium]|nr:hypothetical protein [Paracoccaceae bacterium]